MTTRGYFGIGVWKPKNGVNVGTLWRSAQCMGAAFIFTIQERFHPKAREHIVSSDPALAQQTDTMAAWKHVPYLTFESVEKLVRAFPLCNLIGVERSSFSVPLTGYAHSERAIYLLGAEDGGIPRTILEQCKRVVEIPSTRCLNVAVAGSIVIYDRYLKQEGR